VHVHCGDSTDVLPRILAELREPALFWLDAHVSTTRSARGTLASPAREELELILAHPVPGHVVLVDDARLLTGEDGWPSVDELRALVAAKPGLRFEVSDDIVRVFPG
jgi:hypothetical protein